MNVTGDLFVVGQVAPSAISRLLNGVVEPRGVRVTLRTGQIGMRKRSVRVDVDQGNHLPGQFLSLVPRQPVAVEAESLYLLLALWAFWIDAAMTGHTGLILRIKDRQVGTLFVTGPALFILGSRRIELPHSILTQAGLGVRSVASNTIFEIFAVPDLFVPVDPLIQIVHGIIMAVQARVHAEKVFQRFADICRIGMKILPGNILVTVLTGILHVGRNV